MTCKLTVLYFVWDLKIENFKELIFVAYCHSFKTTSTYSKSVQLNLRFISDNYPSKIKAL